LCRIMILENIYNIYDWDERLMRDMFKDYYSPSQDQFEELWNNCIFVFDANALLNLYRYSYKTMEVLIDIIKKLSDRVWIPHQVALEYHANRTKVIYEQSDAYHQVRSVIGKASNELIKQLDDELKKYKKSHPFIELAQITGTIEGTINSINEELEKQERNHPNYIENDSIRDTLEKVFSNKIGSPFSEAELKELYVEGEHRYKQKRPPGYKDAPDKKDKRKYYRGLIIEDQYGDLIVWKQIIDEAVASQKSVVFVTDDVKEDWWQRDHGKITGPRIELLDEFTHLTGQRFHMYESYRFIEFAQNFLKEQVDEAAIHEAQKLKESAEQNYTFIPSHKRKGHRIHSFFRTKTNLDSVNTLTIAKNELLDLMGKYNKKWSSEELQKALRTSENFVKYIMNYLIDDGLVREEIDGDERFFTLN